MTDQRWTLSITPCADIGDYPVGLPQLAEQIVSALPAEFWQATRRDFEFLDDARAIEHSARHVARQIVNKCECVPHWYVQGIIAENTATEDWSLRMPTLFEKANNQMQHGLDNLEDCLVRAVKARLDSPGGAQALLEG